MIMILAILRRNIINNIIGIIPDERNQNETEKLKLPGTINGDERMHIQMSKYLHKDKTFENKYDNSLLNIDPFKKRDSHYMAFKYHKADAPRNLALVKKKNDNVLYKSMEDNYRPYESPNIKENKLQSLKQHSRPNNIIISAK